jgi:hypothetical protein
MRFLSDLQRLKFQSRVPKLVKWYNTAREAFIYKDEIPYIPNIYVIPFYVRITSHMNSQTLILHEIATTFLDAENPKDKWAVYLPYSPIKNAPKEINIANLAHELVHIWHEAKGVEAISSGELAEAIKQDKTSVDIYRMKERGVKHAEDMYQEPVRGYIISMEKEKTKQPAIAKEYLAGIPGVTEDEFGDKVLGDSVEVKRIFAEKLLQFKEHLRR